MTSFSHNVYVLHNYILVPLLVFHAALYFLIFRTRTRPWKTEVPERRSEN